MSEPWTCPSCQFEWVVPVGGECLSCGYSAQPVAPLSPEPSQRATARLGLTPPAVEDALAPLYAPGHYPPPVEVPPVLNGVAPAKVHPNVGAPDQTQQPARIAWPSEQEAIERSAEMVQEHAKLRLAMQQAQPLIQRLGQEVIALKQQLAEAAAAESAVRAELAQWQESGTRARQHLEQMQAESQHVRGQLVALAEENQRLRGQATPLALSPRRQAEPHGGYLTARLEAVEQSYADLQTSSARHEELLVQVLQALTRLQGAQQATPPLPDDPEAYQTFIATDSQAARIEQEILRNQAQYGQGWRG